MPAGRCEDTGTEYCGVQAGQVNVGISPFPLLETPKSQSFSTALHFRFIVRSAEPQSCIKAACMPPLNNAGGVARTAYRLSGPRPESVPTTPSVGGVLFPHGFTRTRGRSVRSCGRSTTVMRTDIFDMNRAEPVAFATAAAYSADYGWVGMNENSIIIHSRSNRM